MTDRSIDPRYLAYQYGTAEKVRIRQEAHRLYSERSNDEFFGWVVTHLGLAPRMVLADIGCGPGTYHRLLAEHQVRVVALDYSFGMAQEARRQAAAHGWPRQAVQVLQADAQALPLRAASYDRVLAAHMLYHVPDQVRALREMRRVLRPGGRVVLVTGAGEETRLLALHREVAQELGYTPENWGGARFTLHDLDLVCSVFPGAERHVFHNAFVFPNAAAALRYYASGLVDAVGERSEGGSHRARLLPAMEARIRAIVEQEGVFRDPKNNGCFVATV